MNIKNLLKEIKNTNWEIKKLEEIINRFSIGHDNINKSRDNTGQCPAVIRKNIFKNKFFIDKFDHFVDENTLDRKPFAECGDILISKDYTVKNLNGICLFNSKTKALIGQHIYFLKHNQNPKYLYFALTTKHSQSQIKSSLKEGLSSIMFLHSRDIKKIKIPLPEINIQEKIGNFLFKFAEYDKKLNEELTHRRKQFNYYKEKLFFQGIDELNWKIKELGEVITEIQRGSEATRAQLGTGDFPVVKCGDINSYLPLQFEKCTSFVDINLIKKPKYCECGDILMSNMSNKISTLGTAIVYLGNKKCLAGEHVMVLKSNQNTKYITYALSTEFCKNQIHKLTQMGIVCELHKPKLQQIKIPIPSLKEQEKIVNVLDKFFEISENPHKGIQLLIKQNQKQYEYYKELIFEKSLKEQKIKSIKNTKKHNF